MTSSPSSLPCLRPQGPSVSHVSKPPAYSAFWAFKGSRHWQTRFDPITWLSGQSEAYAYAFEKQKVIRAAIDHAHVKPDAMIAGAREIAFFPPMTGG